MMTTLLLVRHVHTEANEHGSTPRLAGWSDVAVSNRGESELEQLRSAPPLRTAPLIYSSTVPRAVRTANALAHGRDIVTLRSIREISCGEVDGWLISDVERKLPELWRRNLAQDDPGFRWPGGETYRAFRSRVLRAVRGIASRHRGETVLVVTHAGAIAQVVGEIRASSPARWECYRPANATMTTVEVGGDGALRLVDFGRSLLHPLTREAGARRHVG